MTRNDVMHEELWLLRLEEVLDKWPTAPCYPPPVATLNSDDNRTKESGTGAEMTPVRCAGEVLGGVPTITGPGDSDDRQELMDAFRREVDSGLGVRNLSGNMSFYRKEDEARFETLGLFWNPDGPNYLIASHPLHYGIVMMVAPRDDVGQKTLRIGQIKSALKVYYLYGIVFHERNKTDDRTTRVEIPYSAYGMLGPFPNYTFDTELLADGVVVADTEYALDSQPKIPTVLELVVSGGTVQDDITVTGEGPMGEEITEVVAISATGTYYTKNVFSRVYDAGDGDDFDGISIGSSWNGASLEVNAKENYHSQT